MSNLLFTEERYHILAPLRVHQTRMLSDQEEYEPLTRASEIMLNSEEPSIRTYFCAKNVVMDYIRNHPSDSRGFKELGKVHLYSCVPENLDLAQEALEHAQSLCAQQDAEVWFLISMCHQFRIFGWNNSRETQSSLSSARSMIDSKKYKTLLKFAEQGLKLALQYSNGSNVYRFALSDFYISINRLSKALVTLQSGISNSQRTLADAAIFHQLGRFGISCLNGLCERGRADKAKEVAAGALQYYRQAIEIRGNDAEEWKIEFGNAQAIVDQLSGPTLELSDFAMEPDFHSSTPTSLRSWSSSPTQESIHSPTQTVDYSSQSLANSSLHSIVDNLTEYLDTIENQALTYEEGGADDVIEQSWPLSSSQPGENAWHSTPWTNLSSNLRVHPTGLNSRNHKFIPCLKNESIHSEILDLKLESVSVQSDSIASLVCSPPPPSSSSSSSSSSCYSPS